MARTAMLPLCLLCFLALASLCLAGVNAGTLSPNQVCEKNVDCKLIRGRRALSCIPHENELKCRPKGDKAKPCNDLRDCDETMDFNGNKLRCLNGICALPGKLGTNCSQYLDDGDCEGRNTCIQKTCRERSKIGGVCDVFWNCEDGLACIRSRCRKKSGHGGLCDSSIDCINSVCARTKSGEHRCDSDIGSIFGSLVAFTFVIITTGTLQFCAWRPRRR